MMNSWFPTSVSPPPGDICYVVFSKRPTVGLAMAQRREWYWQLIPVHSARVHQWNLETYLSSSPCPSSLRREMAVLCCNARFINKRKLCITSLCIKTQTAWQKDRSCLSIAVIAFLPLGHKKWTCTTGQHKKFKQHTIKRDHLAVFNFFQQIDLLSYYLFVYSSRSSLTVTLIMNQLLSIILIYSLAEHLQIPPLFLQHPCISHLTPCLSVRPAAAASDVSWCVNKQLGEWEQACAEVRREPAFPKWLRFIFWHQNLRHDESRSFTAFLGIYK